MSNCADLIGLRYRLGADGSNGEIDCIHLVYTALERMAIPTPAFNPAWYDASWPCIARALLAWGNRVERPSYDGDVLVLQQSTKGFAVAWHRGILYINRHSEQVAWCPVPAMSNYHCFRLKRS